MASLSAQLMLAIGVAVDAAATNADRLDAVVYSVIDGLVAEMSRFNAVTPNQMQHVEDFRTAYDLAKAELALKVFAA